MKCVELRCTTAYGNKGKWELVQAVHWLELLPWSHISWEKYFDVFAFAPVVFHGLAEMFALSFQVTSGRGQLTWHQSPAPKLCFLWPGEGSAKFVFLVSFQKCWLFCSRRAKWFWNLQESPWPLVPCMFSVWVRGEQGKGIHQSRLAVAQTKCPASIIAILGEPIEIQFRLLA